MASTFTTSLKFNKPALGDAGWGTAVNGGFTDLADQALGGQASIDVGSGPGPFVLTIPDGASGDARNMFIRATGNPGGAREIQVPTNRKLYFVTNDSDGAVTVKVLGQTGVVVPVGASMALRINPAGTDVGPALTYQASMTLGTALAAPSGGTGQSSYAVGDLLYADTTTTLAKLASVAEGSVLRAKGVGTAPAWEQVDLTTDVTDVLPAANGGTGLSDPGTAGNVLRSDGAGAWTSSALASATDTAEGLVELATDAEVRTGTDTTRAITPDALRKGALVFEGGTFPTSGTTVDFTGIPSWVQRITIMFDGLSTSGSDAVIVQLGASGGIEDSGYTSVSSYGGSVGNYSSSTRGFIIDPGNSVGAAQARRGAITLVNIYSSRWVCSGAVSGSNVTGAISGSKLISGGTLTQLRITTDTASPTNTFDAGLVNIMYE